MADKTEQELIQEQLAAMYADDTEAPDVATTAEPATLEAVAPEPVVEVIPEPVVEVAAPEPTLTKEEQRDANLSIALRNEREEKRAMRAEIAELKASHDATKAQIAEYNKLFEPEPDPVDPQMAAFQAAVQEEVQRHLTPLQQQLAEDRQNSNLHMAKIQHTDFSKVTGLDTVNEVNPYGDPSHPVVQALQANPYMAQQIQNSPNRAEALYQYAQSVMASRPASVAEMRQTMEREIRAEYEAKMKTELGSVAAKFQAGTGPRGSIAAIPGSPTVDDGLNVDNVSTREQAAAMILKLYGGE